MTFGYPRSTLRRKSRMKDRSERIRRDWRKRLGTAKPKPGSRRALKKECKSVTAQLVKARDGHQCGQCADAGIPSNCVIDAGHLYPVSAFPAVEFDLENIHGQCRRHNTIHIGSPHAYRQWFIDRFGHERLEALHERAVKGEPPTDDELRRMIAERKQKVDELRCYYEAMV